MAQFITDWKLVEERASDPGFLGHEWGNFEVQSSDLIVVAFSSDSAVIDPGG